MNFFPQLLTFLVDLGPGLIPGVAAISAGVRAFGILREEAQQLRRVKALTAQRASAAEQLAAWLELDAARSNSDGSAPQGMGGGRLDDLIASSRDALSKIDAELEENQRALKADNSNPKLVRRSEVARWTVLLMLVAPLIFDLAILAVSVPVALRISGGWPLTAALSVVFPATSGSGWAALVMTFFIPHIAATSILGWWAFRLRKLDSEKFAKATETARSLLGGYISLLALIACIYVVRVAAVGWFDNFAVSLKDLTKPLLPILSVAAFVATFGPGYSKYAEGMAEIEKSALVVPTP